ncbi:MAG: trypsin-like peptidase domain-containing protein [Chloroflexi bacterium]|nr:trypsin-like peptidase domain-containing protein [Chloroflexota bacterium]
MWRSLLCALLLACALSLGCDRASELIPGTGADATPRASSTSAVIAPPLLAPAVLRVAGSAGASGSRPAIPNGELAGSIVVVQALGGAGGPAVVRAGSGVVVDRAQRLVLTSYALVQPFREDGARAYAALAVGAAAQANAPLEFAAAIVAASPQHDLAVLRVTGAREEGANPPFELNEAVLADAATLRRGDRLRVLAQPSAERAQAVQLTNATVEGFRGDGAGEARAWLSLDARLPGTYAGAPLFDQSGALVGVASQLAFDPAAPIATARPLTLALELLSRARDGGPNLRHRAPLQHGPLPSPQTPNAAAAPHDSIVVSRPAFARHAIDGRGTRDLFDYTSVFKADAAEVHYEFAAQGVPPGASVQELWYLNGVLQDGFSSAYTWTGGGFAVVSDRMTSLNARKIPSGAWTLEIWVAGRLRSSATAFVGTTAGELARKPQADAPRFAATLTAGQQLGERAAAGATQLLAVFAYRQAQAAHALRWVVTRDGSVMYQSPALPWHGGDHGSWWVGFATDGEPIGAGAWEVEVYFDDQLAAKAHVDLR